MWKLGNLTRKRTGVYVRGQRVTTKKLISGLSVTMAVVLAGVLALNLAGGPVQAAAGGERVAYYGSWDIYGNDYTLKKVNDTGAARKLTTLVYSFENINPTTLQCFQDTHAVDTDESNPNGGDGGADSWGDYQYPFPANRSVDGVADSPTQALRGNFNQLKKLKQKNPNLKVMLSIGGWSFSKFFSDAASTPARRAAFVSSCVDMYIKGNLPTNVAGDTTAGGVGVAAGIFDGIDIDWEFPGSPNGHLGNHVSTNDTANYTALLAEFRSQLNTQGTAAGKYYRLTSAVPSGGDDIAEINVPAVASYLDYAGIMSYDMHGAWEQGTGATTNFQAPLYPSTANPDTTHHFTVDEAVTRWQNAGMPNSKIVVGLPFYWRGWSGVPAGGSNTYGLYQSVGGSSPAFPISGTPGVAHYKELASANKLLLAHKDTASGNSPWIYDNGNFYTGDTPASLAQKGSYIVGKGLAGAMIYSLESDDPSGSLLSGVIRGLGGGVAYAPPTAAAVAAAAHTSPSSAHTTTVSDPINVVGGNFLASQHGFSLPNKDNPIDFSLSYSSASSNQLGTVGMGWQHSYQIAAIPTDDGTGNVIILNPDGRMDQYTPNGSGGFNAPQGVYDTLSLTSGFYKVTHKDRSVYNFNAKNLINTIVSPNGNTQTVGYNTAGQLTTITDSNSRSFTLAYDNDTGMVNTVTDPSGRVVTYTYNALLELVQVKNPANEITKYEYDSEHHLTKIIDPRNNTVAINVYDSAGKVTQQTNALNKVVNLNYATPGQTSYTDANGGTSIYFYDTSMRITKVQDALGGNTITSYDTAGNVYQTTDPLNHTTTRLYDTRNNLTQITDPAGGIQSFTYDSNDNVLTHTDQLGRVTTYTYDSKGNVLTKKDPLNKTTTFAYDLLGQLTSVTDALNNLTGFVYDSNGNQVTKTDPSNRNTYYGYDAVGRMTAVETHNLNETDYTLDAMDRLTKSTDPSGHDTNILYDADGNKTKVTDANNHATNYTYDANNNLTKTTNALIKDTLYEYDSNDNLVKKTDAKGKITLYAYDLLNRQKQITDPLGNISKITYDAAGNVATRVDASNRTTSYTYDSLNRLTTVTYPDATTATRTYDAVGNLLTATNASGTTTNTYDANNHMLTSKDPHNATITYTYNAVGSLSTVKYPDNKLVTYTYTPSNQLSTVVDWNNATTTYLYDNDAQLASKTLPNTIKGTYAYDSNGNLSTLTYKKGTAAYTKYTYTRDNIGNVTEEDETKSSGTHVYNDYTYDAANQLTMNDAPADTYNYTYDDVGNMATSVTASGTSTYTYNNANQLTAKTNAARSFTYDAQGNQITDTGKTLGYNYDNQLTSLVNGATTTNYIYDATGNRIDKTQAGTGATNYQYISTGNNRVLQAKNITASTSQYYLYGLEQISQGDTASSTRQYPITDGQGTVRYLTNNSGTTITNGTFAYDPYGKQTSGSAVLSSYMFHSEQKDSESGLTYLRARYYDPTIGRFTSKDPMSGTTSNPASQNGYNYANDDPINLSDPLGLAASCSGKTPPSISSSVVKVQYINQLMKVNNQTYSSDPNADLYYKLQSGGAAFASASYKFATSRAVNAAGNANDAYQVGAEGGTIIGCLGGAASISAAFGPELAPVGCAAGGASGALSGGVVLSAAVFVYSFSHPEWQNPFVH
jgi:RHS repeat-associated protein